MPKYEYACKSCGEHIEVVQSFADAALTECPACAGVLRKVFSPPSIAFKGSGFYRTDNRKRRTEPPSSDAKPDSKSDSKVDAKPGSSSDKSESKSDKSEPAKADAKPSTTEAKPKAAEAKTA